MQAGPQRVVVVGAGVIGVTSAYCLAADGHQVTVIERQPGAALETSYANAGEISPGDATPWAAPGTPWKVPGWLLARHAPLILRPKADARMYAWLWQWLRNCGTARYERNAQRMMRLAAYSREQLVALRGSTGIEYDQRTLGTLRLYRTRADLRAIDADIKVLRNWGVPHEALDAAGCVAAEPGLAHARTPIAGGLRLPQDETGDCHVFTRKLAQLAAAGGVDFRYCTTAQELLAPGGRIAGVATDAGVVDCDACVIAAGSYSPSLLRPLGLKLPVYPVKGYSITVPVIAEERAPVSTVLDETYKVAITRLGGRIRVGGMAQVSGYDLSLDGRRRDTLQLALEEKFPGAGDMAASQFWTGLRPMTPDGTPVVGPSGVPGVYINAGHGTLGWTMACGSARVLADLVAGRAPAIEAGDLGLARYQMRARSAGGR